MQYLILSILAFLGLYCGLAIGILAKEELKPGREYLKWLLHLLFVAILLTFLYLNRSVVFFITIPALLIIFSFSRRHETLYYYVLAVMMYLSYIYNGFTLIAPLIFLYGFPLGSVYLTDNIKESWQKNAKAVLFRYGGFLLISLAFEIVYLLL